MTADESATEGEGSKDNDLITSLKSYSIDASDLTVYGQKNLYNSGNSNPFDYAEEATTQSATTEETTGQNTTTTQTGNSTNTNNASTNNASTTPGTFFENPSSK